MPATKSSRSPVGEPRAARGTMLRALQCRVADAFGLTADDQRAGLEDMLQRSAKEAPAYWLQLVLSMGIATLGLVLGSTAVVIGAMLISPLMGPIVELGMGLAVGSPLLVLRSGFRVAISIAVVVALSALVVYSLPFHEVTHEIASRTTPNALDLLIAVFCAVSAAYTTTQRGADTTATAAGTAIGIALVPPLCVVGYGVGARSATIAGGATLLFTANFCAIVFFAVLVFLLLGYNRIDVVTLEATELDRGGRGRLRRAAGALHRLFHARYGTLLRVLMPLALVGSIIFPLRSALAEVAWQVRVRASIQGMLAELRSTVRSTVSVDRHAVGLRLVVVGSPKDATLLQADLATRIAAVSGVKPRVDVLAVPDVETMKALAADVAQPAPAQAPAKPDLADVRSFAGAAIARLWPAAAGALLRWSLDFRGNSASVVHVIHIGAPLGPPGEQLLAGSLGSDLGIALRIDDRAFPAEPSVADIGAGDAWLAHTLVLLGRTSDEPLLRACVEVPDAKGRPARDRKELERIGASVRAALPSNATLLTVPGARQWRITVATEACVLTPSVPSGPMHAVPNGADAG